MATTGKPGRELLDFIEQLGELSWFKFESRYPVFKFRGQEPKTEDRSTHPPYTSFRFKVDNPDVIAKLKLAVRTYKGSVEWLMEEHLREMFPGTRNWIISPRLMSELNQIACSHGMTVGQYIAQISPEFGPLAYSDLAGLTAHVRSSFNGY